MSEYFLLEMSFDPSSSEKGLFICWLTDKNGRPIEMNHNEFHQLLAKDPTTELLASDDLAKQTIVVDWNDDYKSVNAISVEMWRMFLLLNKEKGRERLSSIRLGKSFTFWCTVARSLTKIIKYKQYYPTLLTINKHKYVYAYSQWMVSRNALNRQLLDEWLRLDTDIIFSLTNLTTYSTKGWLNLLIDHWLDQVIRELLKPIFVDVLEKWKSDENFGEIVAQWYFHLLHNHYDFFYVATDRSDIQKLFSLERQIKNWHYTLSGDDHSKLISAKKEVKETFIKSGFTPKSLHLDLTPLELNHENQRQVGSLIWKLSLFVTGYENDVKKEYQLSCDEITKSYVKKWVDEKLLYLAQLNDLFHAIISEKDLYKDTVKVSLDEVTNLVSRVDVFKSQNIFIHLPDSLSWKVLTVDDINVSLSVSSSFNSAKVNLQSLLDFKWDIAIGDWKLTVSELKELIKNNIRMIREDNYWVILPYKELEQLYRELVGVEEQLSQRSSISTMLQLQLKKEEDSQINYQFDPNIENYIERLLQPVNIQNYKIPKGFVGELRDYQERGFYWLKGLYEKGVGGCLADDMGLGKTIQTIAYLLTIQEEEGFDTPALVVCPTSVLENWQKELATFAPSLSVYLHHGIERFEHNPVATNQHIDVIITSYALLVRDNTWFLEKEWKTIIVDEAQYIKNSSTKQSQYIRQLKAQHRIALTGTPMENNLNELWTIMEFVNPGYLGSLRRFRKLFVQPITTTTNKEGSLRDLQKLIQPFFLRRTKMDKKIINDLPAKLESKQYCSLSKEQIYRYQSIVDELSDRMQKATGIERKGIILSTITKLKQICNYPYPYDSGLVVKELSGKLQMLYDVALPIIKSGDKVLVFSQYVRTGKMLETFFSKQMDTKVFFLHGGLASLKREKLIQQFREVKTAVMILSIKAGGVGLNLTEANHVFHFDRWWNPAVENQATDRAFRIGQNQDVHVYKFITKGTLEEGIDKMIDQKQDLTDKVIGMDDKWITEMTNEEVFNLIRLREQVLDQ